jgi:hypothetical protein
MGAVLFITNDPIVGVFSLPIIARLAFLITMAPAAAPASNPIDQTRRCEDQWR